MLDYHRAHRLATLAADQERLRAALRVLDGSGLSDQQIREKMVENNDEIAGLFVEAREL